MSDQQQATPSVASSSSKVASAGGQDLSDSAKTSVAGTTGAAPSVDNHSELSHNVSAMSIEQQGGQKHRSAMPGTVLPGGSTLPNGFSIDHARKTSNMSASGQPISMPNGSLMAHGRTPSIKFGSFNPDGSPVVSHNQLAQAPGVAALAARSVTPLIAQSPIIQPVTSGGRPPSALQTPANGVPFGSLQGDPMEVVSS